MSFNRIKNIWIVLCFGCLVFPIAGDAKEIPINPIKLEGRDWIKVSSPYFHIVSDEKEEDVRGLARELEKFRVVAQVVTGVRLSENDRPVKVFATKHRYTFKALMGTFEHYKKFRGIFFDDDGGQYAIVKMRGRNKSDSIDTLTSKSVIFHEYIHYVTSLRSGRPLPIWFREGIADYLSTVRFDSEDDRVAYLGNIIRYHIENIRNMKWLPIEEVLKTTQLNWKSQRDTYRMYSQGWLLTHYCMNNEKKKKQLFDYLAMVLGGVSIDEAFQESFGMSYKKMDKVLRKYSRKKRFNYGNLIISQDHLVSDIVVEKMEPSDVLYQIGDVLLNVVHNFSDAEVLFDRSISLNKNNANSLAGLANLALVDGELGRATDLIDEASRISQDNIWVNTVKGHIYRSLAYGVEDRSSNIFTHYVNSASKAYGKAVNSGHINIEALIELSYFYVNLGKNLQALQIAEVASSYSPSNHLVRKSLINASYANGKILEAEKVIDSVRANPHWSEVQEKRFDSWLVNIKKSYNIKN